MSLGPEPQGGGLAASNSGPNSEASLPNTPRPRLGWQRRLLRISLALFTFEVGLFLVIFPWTENWDVNYFQGLTPGLQDFWQNPSFRGALTGLGFVNIYIACLQVVHSFRRT
jgi:hypothetical protein